MRRCAVPAREAAALALVLVRPEPAGGQNVWLGVELRRLLAKHIFKRCGENFKAFQYVEFSFGYNMEVGDNVVVHRNVLLDDRGGIRSATASRSATTRTCTAIRTASSTRKT